MPMVRKIVAEATANNLKISALVQAIVRSPAFRMTSEGPTTTTETVAARPE
jgi:hypothetical protein